MRTKFHESERTWEVIEEHHDRNGGNLRSYSGTARMKVIGGWLVKTVDHLISDNDCSISSCLKFVADKDHAWEYVKPEQPPQPAEPFPLS